MNNPSVAMAEMFSSIILVRSQQELIEHTAFGEDLRCNYAINHTKKLAKSAYRLGDINH